MQAYKKSVLWLSVLAACAWGQPVEQKPRPKVGLVLGGGQALGLSHIGVIQWLEEHRIPVDLVTGASMGALVGGTYATGADAEELRKFVAEIDWAEAFSNGPGFPMASYRRKEDERRFPNQFVLGIHDGVHLPAGYSPGHGAGLVLSRIASRYDGLNSFDELPIPFGCVATDLISGKEVVLRSGRLFDALRSTIAMPGIFTPWRMDGKVLVDGGVLNNLPVDVARAMGAEYVIAVVLETKPIDEKAVRSVLGVARRTLDVMIVNNEKRSMAMADLVLYPELKDFDRTDYERAEELRERGYRAAESKRAALERFALPEKEWEEYMRARRARRREDPAKLEFVEVETRRESTKQAFESELAYTTQGPLDRARLEKSLSGFAGLGRYGSADYQFARRGNAEGLRVNVTEKVLSTPVLNLLFQVDGATGEGLRFGTAGRLTFFDLGGSFSEWRTDASIGAGNNFLGSEYYWRVNRSRLFLAPALAFADTRVPISRGGQTVTDLSLRQWSGGGDVGWAHSRTVELRAGFRHDRLRGRLDRDGLQLPDVKGGYNSLHVRFGYEGQDSALVPKRGFRVAGQYRWVFNAPGAAPGFGVTEGAVGYAHPIRGRYSFLSAVSGGVAASRAGAFSLFTLGGMGRLTALSRNQLYGNRYYLANVGILRMLNEKAGLLGRFYAATFYEVGAANLAGDEARPYHNGTLGVVGETFFGIVFGGVSVGDKGERKLVFRLGRLF